MARLWCFLFVIFCTYASSNGHKFQYGHCPNVQHMDGVDMNKMLGVWYVIEKTKTASNCITYTFKRTNDHLIYKLEQEYRSPFSSQHSTVGTLYNYGESGNMRVEFPMSSASYIVFATDYETFAGIFTCQKLMFANRHSVSILSRTPHLSDEIIEKMYKIMERRHVDPYHLNFIPQNGCPGRYKGPKKIFVTPPHTERAKDIAADQPRAEKVIATYANFDDSMINELKEKDYAFSKAGTSDNRPRTSSNFWGFLLDSNE